MGQAVMMSVDLGRSMMSNYSDNTTRSKLAFECIRLFLQQKFFNGGKHQFGLSLFGDDDGVQGRSYCLHPMSEPKLQIIRQLEQLQGLNTENKLQGGDVFEALKFAVDELNNFCGTKKNKKRVFLFTNGQGRTDYQKQDVRNLARIITETGVKVNIVVIDFMEGYDPENNILEGKTSSNPEQDSNTQLLMLLKDSCQENVKIFPASIAIELYRQFRKKEINPVPIYRGPFEIAPGMSFDVATYSQTRQEKVNSLKRYNTREPFSTGDKDNLIEQESVYHVDGDASCEAVTSDNVINGYKYGPNIIPITPLLEQESKIKQEKCLKLLGFVDRDQVPREMFMGNVNKVIPIDDLRSQKLFSAFVFSMLTLNRYAIARHVSRNRKAGVTPRLVVLIPYKSSTSQCFYLTDLPTAQDVREYTFNPLKKSTRQQQRLVDELITDMDLTRLKDQDGEEFEGLKTKNIFNPTRQALYQALFHRVSHPDAPLPALDQNIRDYMNPEVKMFKQTASYMGQVKQNFGLVKNEIKSQKQSKKILWAQLIKDKEREVEVSDVSTVADPADATYWKKFNFDDEPVLHVSPSNPISTFESMMNYHKSDLVSKAIGEMSSLILDRISNTNQTDFASSKIIECMKALRRGCIKEREQKAWDSWLESNVSSFGAFIKTELRNEGLGYIERDNKDLFSVEGGILTKNLIKVQYDDLD